MSIDPAFAVSTGAIIAIAVIAAIILILLLVLLPKMRAAAADKKAEQERREAERRLEGEREEKAQEHRSVADNRQHQAELAEAEAKRARAEADINAKRAELHEQGLADDELPSGAASPNGRVDESDVRRDRDPDGVRDLGGGGRAHEPAIDPPVRGDTGRGGSDSDYERGLQEGRERTAGGGSDVEGEQRLVKPEDHNEVDEGRPGPLR